MDTSMFAIALGHTYKIHIYIYKEEKRGRGADPLRNNSKRKTSRIDNWHHETEEKERDEEACLTRGDARSRTLDGIDERQWRWVRERSSREKEKEKSVSFSYFTTTTTHIQHKYIDWLCKKTISFRIHLLPTNLLTLH
jgi:hypothetical protein